MKTVLVFLGVFMFIILNAYFFIGLENQEQRVNAFIWSMIPGILVSAYVHITDSDN